MWVVGFIWCTNFALLLSTSIAQQICDGSQIMLYSLNGSSGYQLSTCPDGCSCNTSFVLLGNSWLAMCGPRLQNTSCHLVRTTQKSKPRNSSTSITDDYMAKYYASSNVEESDTNNARSIIREVNSSLVMPYVNEFTMHFQAHTDMLQGLNYLITGITANPPLVLDTGIEGLLPGSFRYEPVTKRTESKVNQLTHLTLDAIREGFWYLDKVLGLSSIEAIKTHMLDPSVLQLPHAHGEFSVSGSFNDTVIDLTNVITFPTAHEYPRSQLLNTGTRLSAVENALSTMTPDLERLKTIANQYDMDKQNYANVLSNLSSTSSLAMNNLQNTVYDHQLRLTLAESKIRKLESNHTTSECPLCALTIMVSQDPPSWRDYIRKFFAMPLWESNSPISKRSVQPDPVHELEAVIKRARRAAESLYSLNSTMPPYDTKNLTLSDLSRIALEFTLYANITTNVVIQLRSDTEAAAKPKDTLDTTNARIGLLCGTFITILGALGTAAAVAKSWREVIVINTTCKSNSATIEKHSSKHKKAKEKAYRHKQKGKMRSKEAAIYAIDIMEKKIETVQTVSEKDYQARATAAAIQSQGEYQKTLEKQIKGLQKSLDVQRGIQTATDYMDPSNVNRLQRPRNDAYWGYNKEIHEARMADPHNINFKVQVITEIAPSVKSLPLNYSEQSRSTTLDLCIVGFAEVSVPIKYLKEFLDSVPLTITDQMRLLDSTADVSILEWGKVNRQKVASWDEVFGVGLAFKAVVYMIRQGLPSVIGPPNIVLWNPDNVSMNAKISQVMTSGQKYRPVAINLVYGEGDKGQVFVCTTLPAAHEQCSFLPKLQYISAMMPAAGNAETREEVMSAINVYLKAMHIASRSRPGVALDTHTEDLMKMQRRRIGLSDDPEAGLTLDQYLSKGDNKQKYALVHAAVTSEAEMSPYVQADKKKKTMEKQHASISSVSIGGTTFELQLHATGPVQDKREMKGRRDSTKPNRTILEAIVESQEAALQVARLELQALKDNEYVLEDRVRKGKIGSSPMELKAKADAILKREMKEKAIPKFIAEEIIIPEKTTKLKLPTRVGTNKGPTGELRPNQPNKDLADPIKSIKGEGGRTKQPVGDTRSLSADGLPDKSLTIEMDDLDDDDEPTEYVSTADF